MSRDEFGVPAAQHPIPPDELLPLPMHVGWLYLYSEQSVQQVYGYTASQTQAYAHANCRPLREKVRALEDSLRECQFGNVEIARLANNKQRKLEAAEAENAKLREALVLARQELAGLPHSLGYEFTHLPKIDAALSSVAEKEKGGGWEVSRAAYARSRLLYGGVLRVPERSLWPAARRSEHSQHHMGNPMTSTPNEAARVLADRLELAAQSINDAFVVSRWTDAQRVADTLRAAAADLRSVPRVSGMDHLAKLEHKWRMCAGDYTIDCAWRQMYGEVADELELAIEADRIAALRAAPSPDGQGVAVEGATVRVRESALPCRLDNPEAWPPNYAAGWNDAVAIVGLAVPDPFNPAATPPQPAGAVDDAQKIAAEMRAWATGEGCFDDSTDDKPLLMVWMSQESYLALADRIAAFEAARIGGVAAGWLPIESAPKSSEVVLFCDLRGNRWTQCASAHEIPVCGLPAAYWMPLPAPQEPTR